MARQEGSKEFLNLSRCVGKLVQIEFLAIKAQYIPISEVVPR